MWRRIIVLLAALLCFILPCAAEDIEDEYAHMIDSLPGDVVSLLPESFFDGLDGASEGVDEVLAPSFWRELLGELLLVGAEENLPLLISLFLLILLSAVMSAFKDVFRSEALAGAVSLGVSVVAVSIFVRQSSAHIELVTSYVERVTQLSTAMLPVMGTILAMGGSGGAAVATHGGFLMILGVIEVVVGEAFGGIVGISLALSVANIFSGKFRLAAIGRAVRRCFGIFFGSVTALIGFLLSIKIGISAAGDSVAMRGAKIFASNAIPVVGSAVGDSLRTLAASLSYIKSVSGAVGMILVLLLFLPVFIKLWLFRSGLVLLSGAAEMLGCDRERELVSGVVSIYGYILAVIAIVTLAFILMLTLFTKTSLAFGGGI